MSTGTVVKVSGPLVVAEGMRDANMFDVVRVSDKHLIGEIIEMHGDKASPTPDYPKIQKKFMKKPAQTLQEVLKFLLSTEKRNGISNLQ